MVLLASPILWFYSLRELPAMVWALIAASALLVVAALPGALVLREPHSLGRRAAAAVIFADLVVIALSG